MGNIVHRHSQRGKRHTIKVEVTPKSAKGRAMLAQFKRQARAFNAKWKKAFPKKRK
jgi:hypothetical protein